MPRGREAELYAPVKAFLEAQGYEVKAEIGACDLMAVRGEEPPVVVELKTGFTLALVMQGVQRQTMFEHVYLAVPAPGRRGWASRYGDMIALCRRLGLGLLAVGPAVEAHLDPGPYAPRRQTTRAGRLLREFQRRVGDPNTGGTTGIPRMTAYRQDALRIAAALGAGPAAPRQIAVVTGIDRVGQILRADHYGWFERVDRGLYDLTPKGRTLMAEMPSPGAVQGLKAMDQGALAGLIGQWGLPAVWLGGLVEGEAAGFMAGLLAHRGFFPLWAAALALAAGGFTCDQTCFWAGRLLSSHRLVRRVLDRPGAAAMAARIAPHPILWAFGLRWLYGLRIVTATVLGASGAAPLRVALAGGAAALLWGVAVTAAGYGLARWLVTVVGDLALHHHLALMVGAGLVLALVVGHFAHRLVRKR